MAIDISGQDCLPDGGIVVVEVKNTHPLILLGKSIPWILLIGLVVEDLKKTIKKGFWYMGRKIKMPSDLALLALKR